MRSIVTFSAILFLLAGAALAGDACTQVCGSPDCCAHCGAKGCCEKYCKVVCEMKEVKKHVWAVKCEEFCPLLPSCDRCGAHDGTSCGGCGECGPETKCAEPACCGGCGDRNCAHCGGKNCDPCQSLKDRCFFPPKCGKMRTKKVLEKKEVVCKVPVYKSVVVYCCGSCGAKMNCGDEKGEPAPAAAPKAEPSAPPPAPEAPLPKSTRTLPLPPVYDSAMAR